MGSLRKGLLPEALKVGVPEMDGQHDEIFSNLESLKAACFGNKDLPVAEFGALVESIARHFASEEQLAEQLGIAFTQHAKVHRDNLQSMRDALAVVLSGVSEAYSFLRFTEFWFERHIIQYDQPFAASRQFDDRRSGR